MTTGKTIALTRRTFVDKVMPLFFNMLLGRSHTYIKLYIFTYIKLAFFLAGFLGGSVVKNLFTSGGDAGLIPGSGRAP